MRSSTRRTTRSFASWSNFLGMFQIFPSTQTEQNLGHFNRVYVGDITYLPCKGGKNMYVATVIDTYSRKLAGYALADHMRVSLVIDALAHAHGVRQP
ncbi:transposase [Corynebacterium diphtheriae subsp. lausannense]|nr:transposase [Corynebacterium diphtheriae subsp. lausannense]